ncbi:hypothetical protein [Marinibactrum halimedae]|uniref:Uncharacterized protein n=1 Tax=Marinibactrum halimedae TaxID=1444977 RepID=A0AA37T6Y9_9GAMM|nr:hypothetical protein [Marinibactrum halimedae]MCD9459531.1 hypothetical protein [Marinibactrum halimedae]GLS28185.1 hypothetical protein GCM10007877_39040 [Marinibactrum halimedae]
MKKNHFLGSVVIALSILWTSSAFSTIISTEINNIIYSHENIELNWGNLLCGGCSNWYASYINIDLYQNDLPFYRISSNYPYNKIHNPDGIPSYWWLVPSMIEGDNFSIRITNAQNESEFAATNTFSIENTEAHLNILPNSEFDTSEYWALKDEGCHSNNAKRCRIESETYSAIYDGKLDTGNMSDGLYFIGESAPISVNGNYWIILPKNVKGTIVRVVNASDNSVEKAFSRSMVTPQSPYRRESDVYLYFSANEPVYIQLEVDGAYFADSPEEADGLQLDYVRVLSAD